MNAESPAQLCRASSFKNRQLAFAALHGADLQLQLVVRKLLEALAGHPVHGGIRHLAGDDGHLLVGPGQDIGDPSGVDKRNSSHA